MDSVESAAAMLLVSEAGMVVEETTSTMLEDVTTLNWPNVSVDTTCDVDETEVVEGVEDVVKAGTESMGLFDVDATKLDEDADSPVVVSPDIKEEVDSVDDSVFTNLGVTEDMAEDGICTAVGEVLVVKELLAAVADNCVAVPGEAGAQSTAGV